MQRKIFRIEQTFAERRAAATAGRTGLRCAIDDPKAPRALGELREEAADAGVQGLEGELALLRETIVRHKQDLAVLIGERNDRRMTRAAGELGTAVDAMEKATQKILQATEIIDDSAKSLGSALKHDHERGLAQDILENAVKIYEACNFQDLAGQRIANVIATLTMVEEQIATMIDGCGGRDRRAAARPAAGRALVNGPRLDGDSGHADQSAIDTMFR